MGQVPGLKKAEIDGRLEEAGIEKVFVVCVNDGAVMMAWKKDQGLAGSELIDFVADTQAELTTALGLIMTGTENPLWMALRDQTLHWACTPSVASVRLCLSRAEKSRSFRSPRRLTTLLAMLVLRLLASRICSRS